MKNAGIRNIKPYSIICLVIVVPWYPKSVKSFKNTPYIPQDTIASIARISPSGFSLSSNAPFNVIRIIPDIAIKNPKTKFQEILGVLNAINEDNNVTIGTIPDIIPTLVAEVYDNAIFCNKKYPVIPDNPAPKKYNSCVNFCGLWNLG